MKYLVHKNYDPLKKPSLPNFPSSKYVFGLCYF